MPQTSTEIARYRPIVTYIPTIGDYIVWAGWFSTWHGLVVGFDRETEDVSIVFAGLPFLLFTMDPAEQKKETKVLKLAKIRSSANGTFATSQQTEGYTQVWYI